MNCLICNKCIVGDAWLSFKDDNMVYNCCSYICSNKIENIHPNYWDNVINRDKFTQYPVPLMLKKRSSDINYNFDEIDNMSEYEYREFINKVLDLEKFNNLYTEFLNDKSEIEYDNYSDNSSDDY